MTHSLTLEVPDDLFQPILERAREAGETPEEWTLSRLRLQLLLNEQGSRDISHEVSQEVSHEAGAKAITELTQHAGSVDLGFATGADNEQIDADLANEYAETHEDNA